MKKIFSFLTFIFFSIFITAQNPSAPPDYNNLDFSQNPDYYEIEAQMSNYLAANPNPRLAKKFRRWAAFWQNKVDYFDGVRGSFIPAMTFYRNQLNADLNIDDCDDETSQIWEALGPKSKKNTGSTTFDLSGIGRMTSIWVDPNNLDFALAGSGSGGIWKSTNANATNLDNVEWVNVTDDLTCPVIGVSEIIVDPFSSGANRTFYAATRVDGTNRFSYGLGILKSVDNGETWELEDLQEDDTNQSLHNENNSINDIVAHPVLQNKFFALKDNKIIKTNDGFETFETQSLFPEGDYTYDLNDIAFHPTNAHVMYLSAMTKADGSSSKFFRSIDGGDNWTEVTLFSSTSQFFNRKITRIDIAVSEVGDDDVFLCLNLKSDYTGICPPNGETKVYTIILKSENKGETFEEYMTTQILGSQVFSSPDLQTFEVSDIVSDRLYLGTGAAGSCAGANAVRFDNVNGQVVQTKILNYSTGSGLVHPDQRNISILKNGTHDIVFFANDGGVSRHMTSGSHPLDPPGISNLSGWEDLTGKNLTVTQCYGMGISTRGDEIRIGSIDNGGDLYLLEQDTWEDFISGDASNMLIDPYDSDIYYRTTFLTTSTVRRIGSGTTASITGLKGSHFIFPQKIRMKDRSCFLTTGDENSDDITMLADRELQELKFTGNAFQPYTNVVNNDSDISRIVNFDIFQMEDDLNDPNDNGIAILSLDSPNNYKDLYYSRNFNLGPNATWENITPSELGYYNSTFFTDVVIDPYNSNRIFAVGRSWGSSSKVLYGERNPSTGEWIFQDIGYFDDNGSGTGGLPKVPFYSLAYQKGSNDKLYIGTEVGVYYLDNATTFSPDNQWKCFSSFPNAIVEDLQISYCSNEIFACTNGRGVYKAPLTVTNRKPFLVEADWDWDHQRIIDHDIIVKSGFTLTITADIFFSDGVKLIAEAGAKIIIDGGKLSTLCGGRWEGIEIWGNSDLAQTPGNQGYLEIKNNAIIEHANTAVKVFNPDNMLATAGGVVTAEDSNFLNCSRGVHFEEYSYLIPEFGIQNNLSRFNNCTFEANDEALDDVFSEHARLHKVIGIPFYACDFKDIRADLNNISDLTRGIYSLDAGFSILPVCIGQGCDDDADWKYSNFEGFLHGVEATTSKAKLYTYTIDRANFTNNRIGVLNRGVDNFALIRSDFLLDAPKWDNNIIGLKIDHGTQFIVEANQFRSDDGEDKKKIITGIVAIETSPSNMFDVNEIYRNSFRNISIGNLSNGDNTGNGQFNLGLKYDCNTNQGVRQFDFAVPNQPELLVEGISKRQGLPDEPTGNTFSQFLPSNDGSNFFNEGVYIDEYYFFGNSNIQNPSSDAVGITPISLIQESQCLSNLESGGVVIINPLPPVVVDGFGSEVDIKRLQLNDLKDEIETLVDKGNTEQLISEINSALAFNADILLNELNELSPYISLEGLKAFANRTDIYSNGQIQNIIELNPDQIRSNLLSFLIEKEIPFSEEQITQLENLQGQVTELTTKLNQRGSLEKEINQTIRFVLQNISQANDTYSKSRIEEWRNKSLSTSSAIHKISDQVTFEDTENAQALLSGLSEETNLDDVVYSEINQMMTLHINIANNESTIYEVSGTQLASLTNLADNGSDVGRLWAQNVLNFTKGAVYATEVIYPNEVQMNSLEADELTEDKELKKDQFISARPNPATDIVQFVYELPAKYIQGAIEIRDIEGRLVKSFEVQSGEGLIEYGTNDLQSGQYIFTLTSKGVILQSDQLIIIK